MALVSFKDSRLLDWRVCEVTVAQIETHRETSVLNGLVGVSGLPLSGSVVLPGLEGGWLSFESWNEKRRLPAPYPDHWRDLSPAELEELCRMAVIVPERVPSAAERPIEPTARDVPSGPHR